MSCVELTMFQEQLVDLAKSASGLGLRRWRDGHRQLRHRWQQCRINQDLAERRAPRLQQGDGVQQQILPRLIRGQVVCLCGIRPRGPIAHRSLVSGSGVSPEVFLFPCATLKAN